MAKKRTWKFWMGRSILLLLLIGAVWVINLIWFRPFSINHFYEKIFVELILDSPEITTQLGIPVLYDLHKDQLDDISDEKQQENFAKFRENYETLLSYDFNSQSQENQLSTRILGYFLKLNSVDKEPFIYHDYPVNQMTGTQSSLPSMMTNAHKLRDDSDVEAYIARLKLFKRKFDQLIDNLKIREAKGIYPPRFINDRVLSEMRGFLGMKSLNLEASQEQIAAVQNNILYTDFGQRIDEIDELGEDQKAQYKQQVANAIETSVFPAYRRLIGYFEKLNEKATDDAGVWKLPDGDAFYSYQLKQFTTTDMSPEEVHTLGLQEVARITEEMLAILTKEGFTDSTQTLGEMITSLNENER
ncbi:MAG: DUF885 domain-containing protein, partial [Bacteroidota bacterium]